MATVTPLSLGTFVVEAGFVGETALFALGDGTVVAGDRPDAPIVAHDGGLLVARMSADGRALISAGDDGRVARTAGDGTVTTLFTRKGKWLDQLAEGPQGAIACAAGRTAWVRLADGREIEFAHEKAVGGVGFLPKGLRLVTATTDLARLHWVTAKGAPIDLPWKGAHTGIVASPDGKFLVTTMQEPALHGWRIDDMKHMRMTGYPAKVKSVSWSAKGRFLATSGAQAAILWPFFTKDGPMGKNPLELGPRDRLVTRVACHPSEDVLAIGYDDGMVLAVRFGDQAEVLLRAPDGAPLSALAWDASGVLVAFGAESGAAGIIDIRGCGGAAGARAPSWRGAAARRIGGLTSPGTCARPWRPPIPCRRHRGRAPSIRSRGSAAAAERGHGSSRWRRRESPSDRCRRPCRRRGRSSAP